MTTILLGVYIAVLGGLGLYGLLGFITLGLFLRHRKTRHPLPVVAPEQWPSVTVQLPIYNERDVVERLINAVARLEYPRGRLQIQVVDDSTDDTTEIARAVVERLAAQGVAIALVHRTNRNGFKAGALGSALPAATGEFIAIFDADFVPGPRFLLETIPYLLADPALGAVQARWGHLNDGASDLTGAQAIALDKHFAVEQLVRHRADYFPKFNGSAGVWRRACIEQAGGWQDDTVCEDLCLSTRAVLGGWKLFFSNETVAPAELPATILAYKSQQARWATGSIQCLFKYGGAIWRAKGQSTAARLYALLTMSAYVTHALVLLLVLLQLPLLLLPVRPPSWLYFVTVLGLGQPILFILAQKALYPDWLRRLRYFPSLLLVAVGIAPSTVLAVGKALITNEFTFARTPKGVTPSYRLSSGKILAVEGGFALYALVALLLSVYAKNFGPVVFLTTALLGFCYVISRTFQESAPFHHKPTEIFTEK